MGDPPEFLVTNPCHTYTHLSKTNRTLTVTRLGKNVECYCGVNPGKQPGFLRAGLFHANPDRLMNSVVKALNN